MTAAHALPAPITVTIPGLRLVSEANAHAHWRLRAKRAKAQRQAVFVALLGYRRLPLPVVVTITRIAPRSLDGDNNVGAAKHCRDQVAAWLGIDDRTPLIEWRYEQEKGAPKTYGVRIAVQPKEGGG